MSFFPFSECPSPFIPFSKLFLALLHLFLLVWGLLEQSQQGSMFLYEREMGQCVGVQQYIIEAERGMGKISGLDDMCQCLQLIEPLSLSLSRIISMCVGKC